MTDDLVAFLRERLDEDEAVARRACEYAEASWKLDEEFGETILWWPPEPHIAEQERKHGLPVVSDQWRGQTIESSGQRIAPHIARHDPARVLADVEAKRQLVRLHGRATLRAGGGAQYFDTTTVCRSCEPNYQFRELSWPCPTLRLLALPYADHADYCEEWRP
jgi:hypothetical protein